MHNETQPSLPWNTGDVPDTLVPAGVLAPERLGVAAAAPSQSTEVHLRGMNVTDGSRNHLEDCFAWNTEIIHLINLECRR